MNIQRRVGVDEVILDRLEEVTDQLNEIVEELRSARERLERRLKEQQRHE